MTKRLHAMFFHAHPDDESSKGAGTMAKMVQEGYRVSVMTFTDGAAGEILNPHLKDPARILRNIKEVRKGEIANALEVLGITEHYDLDFPDSGWCEDYDRSKTDQLAPDCFVNQPFEQVLQLVVAIIRTTKPDVAVTYDEQGGYPHPDHIHTHDVSMAAIQKAADPSYLPGVGSPWEVAKIYYHVHFSYDRLVTLADATKGTDYGVAVQERLERFFPEPPTNELVTTQINTAQQLYQAADALKAHKTQIDPDGHWFIIPIEKMAEIFPFEEYVRVKPAWKNGDTYESSLMDGLN